MNTDMELTTAELTILGLIIERPGHGYDLEQVIEQRGIRQWTDVGVSSIYYLLNKLEKRGLAQGVHVAPGAKSRRVFHSTGAGRQAAEQSVIAYLADTRPTPHPMMVGLANLPLFTEHEYAEALRARLSQIEARIAAAEEAVRSQAPIPRTAREVFPTH